MLLEGLGKKKEETLEAEIGTGSLVTQGIATSIDALSAGLAMAEETAAAAAAEAAVIGVVTFAICMAGVKVGNKVGEKIAGKASVVGGLILISIGISMVLRAGG